MIRCPDDAGRPSLPAEHRIEGPGLSRLCCGTGFALIALIPFLSLFGPAIDGSQSFVYRDAAHFYHPLFVWLSEQWKSGQFPLWNPYENLGQPLVGEATAGLFYPGKLLLLLPLPASTLYHWYVLIHVALAAFTSFYLARSWGHSCSAAGLCSLSYAFSGNVVFQYCNVVFLIGAAWLPLAVLAADRMLRRRRWRWAALLGVVMALVTLGGDPQMAYHIGLITALYAVLLFLRRRKRRSWRTKRAPYESGIFRNSVTTSRPLLVVGAATCGFMLAAVQILPAMQWTALSGRAVFSAPRSLFELPSVYSRSESDRNVEWSRMRDGLLAKTAAGTHHEAVYRFSVGPWRFAECVWPNFSGRQFPENRRWIEALPAEGRAWVPSLYAGLLPLAAGLAAWRWRRGAVRIRWLSIFAAGAVVGSLGWYGIGWIAYELVAMFQGSTEVELPVGEPFGGLYWGMVVTLPGYAYFRYPAKLMVIAAMGFSLLAARGWDDALAGNGRSLRRWLRLALALSAIGLLVVLGVMPWWGAWLQGDGVRPNPLFGPLNMDGAARDLVGSFIHTALLSVLLGWMLYHWRVVRGLCTPRQLMGRLPPGIGRLIPLLVVLVTAVELAVVQRWMVPYASTSDWHAEPATATLIADATGPRTTIAPPRVYRPSLTAAWPDEWREHSSPDRQGEGQRWDRGSLFPRYGLPAGVSMLESRGTMSAFELQVLLDEARLCGPRLAGAGRLPAQATLRALGVDYLVLPTGARLTGWRQFQSGVPTDLRLPAEVEILTAVNPAPRCWIVPLSGVAAIFQPATTDSEKIRRRLRAGLIASGVVRDAQRVAMVDLALEEWQRLCQGVSPDLPEMPDDADSLTSTETNDVRIVRYVNNRVEIRAQLNEPGLVVLSDLWCPGWQARVRTASPESERRLPILRTNRVMRGVLLPAGDHHLEYRFRPVSLIAGALLSVGGVMGLMLSCIAQWYRRARFRVRHQIW